MVARRRLSRLTAALATILLGGLLACGPSGGTTATGASDGTIDGGIDGGDRAPRPPVEVTAQIDRAVATTGDRITYTVRVEHDPGYEIFLAEPGNEIAGFRIVDLSRDETTLDDGRRVDERRFVLRADLVGSYILPGLEVRYRPIASAGEDATEAGGPDDSRQEPASESGGETRNALASVTTSELFVEVASVLPEGEEATDIRDIKPLRRIEEPLPWAWIAGGAVLVALLLAAWLRRRRRGGARRSAAPPHETAFAALEELRRLDFSDPEQARRFFFRISEVLRTYLEGRFGLNATDLTTEEILPRLGELGPRAQGHQRELLRFFQATDRVKFADYPPTEEDIEATYERALSFVEATRPRPEENAGDPGEEAA